MRKCAIQQKKVNDTTHLVRMMKRLWLLLMQNVKRMAARKENGNNLYSGRWAWLSACLQVIKTDEYGI
jgi:hypothetical protein